MKIKASIPIKPLSINKAFQGRRFKTKEYNSWIKEGLLLMGKKKTLKGELSIHVDFYFRYAKKNDIDNCLKTLLDLICKRGWIKDDRQITYLSVCKAQSDRERIEVSIKEFD